MQLSNMYVVVRSFCNCEAISLRMTINLNHTMTGRIQSHQLAEPLSTTEPGCRQEIYRQFDTKFTNIYQEKRYFLAKSNQQLIVDVSLFILAMFMSKNCSCLVSKSDDLNEKLKTAAMLTAVFDICEISVDSELSINCALATK